MPKSSKKTVHPNLRSNASQGSSRTEGDRPAAWVAAVVLAVSILAVYGRSIYAPFIFDDAPAIKDNSSTRSVWPLINFGERPGPLNPPRDLPISGRPLVNLTFALNYYVGELNPVGYHAVNFAIHFLSSCLVWAIVRRALLLPYFSGRFAGSAGWLAMAVSLLWALHPLQTEAVVYVTQRTELMMALFYLATFYCSLWYWSEFTETPNDGGSTNSSNEAVLSSRNAWLIFAVLACALGMASKEVMVSAPLMVLLFERCFLAGSLRDALRRSWPLYVGLASTWLVLLAVNLGSPRGDSAGFALGVSAYQWWLTQAKVLLVYLKLAFWPSPLLLHYVYPYFTAMSEAWMYTVPALLLVVAVCVLLWLNKPLGFLGALLFAILSPTLIVPVVTEIAAERRMYVPLLAIVIVVVVGGFVLVRRVQTRMGGPVFANPVVFIAAVLIITCGFLSASRLAAYSSEMTLWRGVLQYQPDNYMAHTSVGHLLIEEGKHEEAIEELRLAVNLKPDNYNGYNNLGVALDHSGRYPEAIEALQKALQLDPEYTDALVNLSNSLRQMGRLAEAREPLEHALRLNPANAEAQSNMGVLLASSNQIPEAIERFRLATRLDPQYPLAHINLSRTLADTGNVEEAIRELERAIQLQPKRADLQNELGTLLGRTQQNEAAIEHFQAALKLDPKFAQAYFNLALSLAILTRHTDAIAAAERSIEMARRTGQQDVAKLAEEWLTHYREELHRAETKAK